MCRPCKTHLDVSSLSIAAQLSGPEREALLLKEEEYHTPSANKMYCPAPTYACSKFINLTHVHVTDGDGILCECGMQICPTCKTRYHVDMTCAEFQALPPELRGSNDLAVMHLAVELGWQPCPSCHALIELAVGCNHMRCNCGAEFCYLCGSTWKTCGCDTWTEANLIREARARLQNELLISGPLPRGRYREALQRMITTLRERHERPEEVRNPCGHPRSLERIQFDGRHRHHKWSRCGNCTFVLNWYGFLCPHCSILVCYTCRMFRDLTRV